jgi:hypothetical protein
VALLHPKTRKRWVNWLSRLVMVCLVVPLVKLIAFFKVMHIRVSKSKTREEWVAEYLRLEYGEDATDPASLKASDLTYLGRFEVKGYVTDYWQYPTSDNIPAYATMTLHNGTTALSMTDEPPTGEQLVV